VPKLFFVRGQVVHCLDTSLVLWPLLRRLGCQSREGKWSADFAHVGKGARGVILKNSVHDSSLYSSTPSGKSAVDAAELKPSSRSSSQSVESSISRRAAERADRAQGSEWLRALSGSFAGCEGLPFAVVAVGGAASARYSEPAAATKSITASATAAACRAVIAAWATATAGPLGSAPVPPAAADLAETSTHFPCSGL